MPREDGAEEENCSRGRRAALLTQGLTGWPPRQASGSVTRFPQMKGVCDKYKNEAILLLGYSTYELPGWLSGTDFTCQCRRQRFDPWVKKIPRRRQWQPTAVFLPGKSHGQRSLAGYSSWGHRAGDNLETEPEHDSAYVAYLKQVFWYLSLLNSW